MKLLYNQKDNYIEHVKNNYLDIFDMFKDMGMPERAEEAYNKTISKKLNYLNDILKNGIDTGTVVKNMEQIIDIVYDSEKYNQGECYYFIVKMGKKNRLIGADLVLARCN